MIPVLLADINVLQLIFGILITCTSLFLILLILVQRGRGGGLTGALGGMGGQSAFGTKAGDTFTRITIFVSAFWILLSVVSVMLLSSVPKPAPAGMTPKVSREQDTEDTSEDSADENGASSTSEPSGDGDESDSEDGGGSSDSSTGGGEDLSPDDADSGQDSSGGTP